MRFEQQGDAVARGRYAAKAERRRTLAESEERGDVAERERDTAEKALAQYREKAEAKIRRLEDQLATAIGERNAAAGPAVAALEKINAELTDRLAAATAEAKTERRDIDLIVRGFHRYLQEISGLTFAEGQEVILAMLPAERSAHSSSVAPSRRNDRAMMVAVDQARGVRTGDILAEVRKAIGAPIQNAES